MDFREFLKKELVLLDGGMGTLLQERGLRAGELPEEWNIRCADEVRAIHLEYLLAGSNVILANTFGANSLKFSDAELEEIISAAVANARWACRKVGGDRFVALDIGPTGKLLAPLGELDFEDAVSIFAKSARLGEKYGADLIVIETMSDSYETKAALLAVKESTDLPVIVMNAYGADGKLMTGASPAAMVALLEGMGADAIGANCSLGPGELLPVMRELLFYASVPVACKPNAGLPEMRDGESVYTTSPSEFALVMEEIFRLGARALGGCCGTTPEYIKAMHSALFGKEPVPVSKKTHTLVSSYTHAVSVGAHPTLIGERINPSGKRRVREALLSGDMGYILSEAVREGECGAHILDVNVGIPGVNEPELLLRAVSEIQAVSDLPLQIDTADPVAMERALRRYNGKAMINSVSGKAESLAAIFPLAKKYGGVIVALTLDDNGIPPDAEGRFRIAERIMREAKDYGIDKKDLVFDTLTMSVSADQNAAKITLDALSMIRERLGANTVLGISNVSFGLPCREAVNSAFFAMALERGLSAAIMNPTSEEMMRVYHSYKLLSGKDRDCLSYISAASGFSSFADSKKTEPVSQNSEISLDSLSLRDSIRRGFRDRAGSLAEDLVGRRDPLSVVRDEIIPALSDLGEDFSAHRIYLPQLLISAEAASLAFSAVRAALPSENLRSKAKIVLATVKGDIHDIGKNIVALILENYGYEVIDLGKDVAPEDIVREAEACRADAVGLSALMTTTVPSMEKTLKLIRASLPEVRVIVGGAVLTREYAEKMGADAYAADAMEAVSELDKLFGK